MAELPSKELRDYGFSRSQERDMYSEMNIARGDRAGYEEALRFEVRKELDLGYNEWNEQAEYLKDFYLAQEFANVARYQDEHDGHFEGIENNALPMGLRPTYGLEDRLDAYREDLMESFTQQDILAYQSGTMPTNAYMSTELRQIEECLVEEGIIDAGAIVVPILLGLALNAISGGADTPLQMIGGAVTGGFGGPTF